MNLEIFFDKFELFADAPNAVTKMRELVLWSAFSGGFISEERHQPMPYEWVVEGAPMLPAIPSSWSWQKGSEIFDVIRGVSYNKGDASDIPVNGSFPILRANNIGKGVNFDELVYIPRDNIRPEQFLRLGDILIAMSSGSKKLVGKAAPIVFDFHGAFGAFCGVIRNKSKIHDSFLARYFQSPQYTSWVTAAGRGIGINNLSKGDLDSLPIPIPPLTDQKRITGNLDEWMALCDRLEAQQQERETLHAALARASLARFADAPTPANLNFIFHEFYDIAPVDLRKTILTLAVQGKLVPQEPDDEPAEILFRKIQKSLAELQNTSGLPKRERQVFVKRTDESQPCSWKQVRIGELCLSIVPQRDKPLSFSGNIPWVTLPAFNENSMSLNLSGDVAGLSLDEVEKYRLRVVPAGSVLMSCVGRFGLVALLDRDVVPNQQIHGFYFPTDFLDGRFLCYSIIAQKSYIEAQSTTTTISYLNKTKCESIPIALPPLAEQRRIVSRVDELMGLVDALETQLATARSTAEKIMEAVVAELTTQD